MKINESAYAWGDFDQFHNSDEYLPDFGDGDSMGTQAATALSKLVYKWFNDGDVFDNTNFLTSFGNDISGSANWLHHNIPETRKILRRIQDIRTKDEYTELLYNLCELVDPMIPDLLKEPKEGDAYDEDGPFRILDGNEFYGNPDGEDW